jgi:penicillin-binding protein-related factor A (putative recombinase)
MTNYGNRGKQLERAIKQLFLSYQSRGIHCQQNFPEKLHDGTLVNRHGFDFQILFQGKFYAFDAKECAAKSWSLSNAKPHQIKALLDVCSNGGDGFFMVYYAISKSLIRYPAAAVQQAFAENRKSLLPSDGEKITINFLNIKD